MFVVMTVGASEAEILNVKGQILAEGMNPFEHAGAERVVIAVVGEIGARKPVLVDRLAALPGVEAVTPISRPFKLTSREFHPEDTVIRVLDAVIGDGSLTMMAGPCSVESREQLFETADAVKAAGATVLRGGAFKPRTSPYAFQGLGVEALRYLAEARERTGLPIITEVMEPSQVDIVAEYADILQIGTRNMQNYSLLRDVGSGRPAGDAQARLRRHGRGVADGRRVHRQLGQPQRDPVRARHPHVRDVHPQHDGPGGRPAAPPPDPPAGHRRPEPCDGQALAGQAAGDRRHRGRGRRGDGRGPPDPDQALSDAEQQLTLDQFRDLMADIVPVHEAVSGLAARAARRQRRAGHRRRAGEALIACSPPTSPRSGPPRACAASSGCPATSRSAIER